MTVAWFDNNTLIQHNGIGGFGGFGEWDGLLILYRGLIKIPVYCTTLHCTSMRSNFHFNHYPWVPVVLSDL